MTDYATVPAIGSLETSQEAAPAQGSSKGAHLYAHFISFVRRPRTREELRGNRPTSGAFTAIFKLYALQLPLMACALIIISLIAQSFTAPKGITDYVSQTSALQLFLAAVIFAPIAEELVFRLPLVATRWMLVFWAVLMAAVIAMFASNFTQAQPAISIAIAAAFVVFAIMLAFAPKAWFGAVQAGFRRGFVVMFWLSVLTFGLLHLTNFSEPQKATVLAPLLVLPQLIAGVFLGYLRVVYGLTSAIALHMLNNSLAVVPIALLSTANIDMDEIGSGIDATSLSGVQQLAMAGAGAYFLLIIGGGMIILLAMLSTWRTSH